MRKPFEAVNGNADESRKSRTASWAVALGCALATRIVIAGVAGFLVHCEDRLAGSSVITGNPTEIQVGFVGENGPTAFTGRVEIYGATQVPVPGFQPEPLVRMEVDGKQEITLGVGRLGGIADSLWPEGSLEGDSLARFNLVLNGPGEGAIVRGLAFQINKGRFSLKEVQVDAGEDGVALLRVGLTPWKESKALLNPAELDSNRINYLFLRGTGFVSQSENGLFRFNLPEGRHPLSFITLPWKHGSTGPEDSAFVHGTSRPLEAGDVDSVEIAEIEIRLDMPGLYKP